MTAHLLLRLVVTLGVLARPLLATAEAPPSGPSVAETEQLERAQAQLRAGDFERAWELAAPLVAAHSRHIGVQLLGCSLRGTLAPREAATHQLCARAARLAEAAGHPGLVTFELWVAAGALDRALAALRGVGRRFKEDPATPASDWADLARRFASISAVSFGELALRRAGRSEATEETRRWLLRLRRKYGLPPDRMASGVAAAAEPEYAAAQDAILELLHADRLREASRAIDALAERFSKAPGAALLRCEHDLRRSRRRGQTACEAAITQFPDAVEPRVLLGFAALEAGDLEEAGVLLEKALELDPERFGVWRALSQTYEKRGDTLRLDALRSRFRARFRRDLTPR